MKFSALNIDFNSVSFDPLGSTSPPRVLQNARFLLLSTNLARERLQIDANLLLIITSTADKLSRVPTSMTLNDLETIKWWIFQFFAILVCVTYLKSEFSPKSLEIDQDNLHLKLN